MIGGIGPPARWRLAVWRSSISLQPPQAGHDAYAGLHQAHIGLGVRLDRGAMQQDLAAATQGHAGGGADEREGGVFQHAVDLLPFGHQRLDLLPQARR